MIHWKTLRNVEKISRDLLMYSTGIFFEENREQKQDSRSHGWI